MAATQTYAGTVKSFNPNKGWGFVECQELGQDVFLLKGELHGFAAQKGDQVSFTVSQSPKGLQASNVKVITASPTGLQSFFGEIKSFNPSKGFGFISSPASEQIFGKDVFVLKSEFPGGLVPQGAQVMFKAKMEERGPVATDVQLLGMANLAMAQWSGGWQGSWGLGGVGGWGSLPRSGWGAGTGPQQSQQSWGMPSWGGWDASWGWKAPSENEVFFGTLKQINAERGWGHISSEAMQRLYGKDIFVLKSSLETANLQPGQSVSFTVSQGSKGPHAMNLVLFNEQATTALYNGKVKSFNETKGWGFIESPQAEQVFRSDVFLHKRELAGKPCAVGDQVQFMVDITGGRAAAKKVVVRTQAPQL